MASVLSLANFRLKQGKSYGYRFMRKN